MALSASKHSDVDLDLLAVCFRKDANVSAKV